MRAAPFKEQRVGRGSDWAQLLTDTKTSLAALESRDPSPESIYCRVYICHRTRRRFAQRRVRIRLSVAPVAFQAAAIKRTPFLCGFGNPRGAVGRFLGIA
jgi:hypothetical protein